MSKLVRVKLLNDGNLNENGVFEKHRTFPVIVWAELSASGFLASVPYEQLIAIGAKKSVISGIDSLSWFVGEDAALV